jgi:hypothetical protein
MRDQRGFVLIITLIIAVVVAILVFGTAFTTIVDRAVTSNQQGATTAYYVAQAGLQEYKTELFRSLTAAYAGGNDWCVDPLQSVLNSGIGGTDVIRPGQSTGPIAFAGGQYEVTLNRSDGFVILTSVGRVGNSRATVRLVATAGSGPASPWDNAIFAVGASPTARAINGNVAVYGGIHIVEGQVPVQEDLELTGTAGVYNNYLGKDGQNNSDIRTDIQNIMTLTDAQQVANDGLCARIKIERGNLVMGSNAARAGTSSTPLESIHIGEGIVCRKQGNSCTEITDHHQSPMVNLRAPSGVGVNSGYEGYNISLPTLPANFPNDVAGAIVPSAIPACSWLFQSGEFRLPPASPGTARSCTDGINTITWTPAASRKPGYISFSSPSGAPVIVNTLGARIRITGPVEYQGLGTLRAGASSTDTGAMIRVDGSLTPRNGNYLRNNALGLVSSGRMELGVSSQATIAAVAYAAGSVKIDKQTLVVGSLVAQSFDIGSQVPKIAYHPRVQDSVVGLRMPGSEPSSQAGRALSEVSYERR